MLGYMAGVLFLSGIMQARFGESDPVLTSLVVNNGAQLCGIAACMLVVARRVPGGIGPFVLGDEAAQSEGSVWSDLITIAGYSIVAIGIAPLIRDLTQSIIVLIAPDFSFDPHPTLRALNDEALSPLRTIALWAGAALIAPVAEEFFFRGFLLRFVASALQDRRLAIILSSAAFAAVHLSMPYAIPALFFLGILMGAAYCVTRKLYVPVAIHVAFNLKTLVWESLQRAAG
jgi:membrane protease YdiL (CAAX protease family)